MMPALSPRLFDVLPIRSFLAIEGSPLTPGASLLFARSILSVSATLQLSPRQWGNNCNTCSFLPILFRIPR
jgi:hypothetical protein